MCCLLAKTCPVLMSYLKSLTPGLFAPVSVAKVDFIGDTPGTNNAIDTGTLSE